MKPRCHPTSERGASLIFTVILLAVLSIVGVAAVTLSSQERINASTQLSYQSLVECANAAQAKFWADLSAYGLGYLNPGPALEVTHVRFPDGRTLDAPAHYGAGDDGKPILAKDGMGAGSSGLPTFQGGDVDTTNAVFANSMSGGATWVSARCRDAKGREHEVEFAFRFSL